MWSVASRAIKATTRNVLLLAVQDPDSEAAVVVGEGRGGAFEVAQQGVVVEGGDKGTLAWLGRCRRCRPASSQSRAQGKGDARAAGSRAAAASPAMNQFFPASWRVTRHVAAWVLAAADLAARPGPAALRVAAKRVRTTRPGDTSASQVQPSGCGVKRATAPVTASGDVNTSRQASSGGDRRLRCKPRRRASQDLRPLAPIS